MSQNLRLEMASFQASLRMTSIPVIGPITKATSQERIDRQKERAERRQTRIAQLEVEIRREEAASRERIAMNLARSAPANHQRLLSSDGSRRGECCTWERGRR